MERMIQRSASAGSVSRMEAQATHVMRMPSFGPGHGHVPKSTSDYARAIRKRIWVVLAVALVVIPPGTIYSLKQPDRYRAFARILIEPPHFDERVATILPHSGVGQSSRESVEKYVPNQIAELRNPGLAERVAADPDFNFSPAEMARAIALLAKLQTRQHPNSNTFDVMLDGTDRSEVTALLNGLLQEFARQAKQTSTMAITKSQRLASESLGDLKSELAGYDKKIEGILEGSNLFGVGGKSLPEERYLALSSKLAAKESQYESLRQQIQIGKLSGKSAPANHPYAMKIEALKDQRDRMDAWLAQNRRAIRQYNSDPVARNAARMYQQTLDELEQLQKMTMRPESDWSSSILMQYGNEMKQLEQQVKEQLDQAQDAMPQYMNYLSLLREREQKQQNLVTMQDRLSAFDLLAATSSDPVQVVLPAEEPTEPTGPKRKIQMALVVLVGLGLGIGLVCLMESLDHRIKVPEQLMAGVALPLFGVVPRMRRLAALHRGGHLWTPGLPKSVEADAFRNLRASLLCATGKSGRPIVTLLVTSPKPAEGKSTTALNLAATCARCGERTLLIDADLRRPSLTPVFEPQHDLGLVDVLKGDMPWQRALVRTEISTLDYLPAGDPTGVPFEILGTLELAQLVKAVSGHYHRVIIDGPAVLGMADCRMLGQVADAALLVVRSGTESLLPVKRASEILDQSRIKVAGVVFNGLDEDLENWGGLITQMGASGVQERGGFRGIEDARGPEVGDHGELEVADRR